MLAVAPGAVARLHQMNILQLVWMYSCDQAHSNVLDILPDQKITNFLFLRETLPHVSVSVQCRASS